MLNPVPELPPDRTAVVIEDDADISNLLEAVLGQAGFRTYSAANGLDGIDLIHHHQPVLTTLDVNLPGIDGFEVARRIRTFSGTYIIMLSARQEEIDTLIGLDAGADDYLTKPFRPRELRARIEAMLRRRALSASAPPGFGVVGWGADPASHESSAAVSEPSASGPESTIEPVAPDSVAEAAATTPTEEPDDEDWLIHNGLRVNPTMRLVELDQESVPLTRTEFDLLVAIMLRRRRVISKGELAEEARPDLNGFVTDADRRSVETHLANLRRKLGDSPTSPRFVETVRGVGYRLAPAERD